MANIGIIGAGSWGIALSYLLHNNGHQVTVWSALPQEVEELREKRVHRTLPDLTLPEDMVFTGDLEAAMDQKDLLVTAVPSVYVRETAKKMRPFLREGQIVVNVAKGIEEGTLMTLSQILEEELPGANVAVLSGPSHAEEVSRSLPTTCVAGAADKKTAEYIQSLFMSEVFRVYTSPDVLGIELGGALKNVIALAAGILIGKGYSMEEAMKEVKMVVEGVYSAKAALALARKYYMTMPIIEQVNQVLFEGKKASDAVRELMLRDPREEDSGLTW